MMDNIIYTPIKVEELIERVSQNIVLLIKEGDWGKQDKPNDFLTQEEVMQMCKVKAKSTLWNWKYQGILIPCAKAGRKPLYKYDDVIAFLSHKAA